MCWSENVQQHSLNCTRSTDLSVKVFRCRRGMPSPTKTIHMQNGMKMWPGLNGSTWITPLRQDKQYSHANMSWLYLRFQCGSPFVPFVPFISVTFGRVHADRLIATVFIPQLSCRIITTILTTGVCSVWATWPLFVIPKLLRSQSVQARWNLHHFLIFTYELMIPPWAHCGLPNTLHGATKGDVWY